MTREEILERYPAAPRWRFWWNCGVSGSAPVGYAAPSVESLRRGFVVLLKVPHQEFPPPAQV